MKENKRTIDSNDSFGHNLTVRIVKLAELLALTAVFAYIWYKFFVDAEYIDYFRRGDWVIIFIYAVLLFGFGRTYDAFQVTIREPAEIIYSQITAILFTNVVFVLFTWVLYRGFYNILPYLGCAAGQIVIAIIWANAARRWYFKKYPPLNTYIIRGDDAGYGEMIEKYGLDKNFSVLETLSLAEFLVRKKEVLAKADAVFLTAIHSHDRNQILKDCLNANVTVYLKPRLGDVFMQGALETHMMHLPILRLDRYRPVPEFLIFKRIFDIVFSLLAHIILSPLFIIIALSVKLCDGGPVFYKQVRLTKGGKEFKLIKFRSMKPGAEKDGKARLSTGEKDDRVTKVGGFLRRSRLDELPQLINILKGEMSVVGQRPERPEIAARYEKELPEFSLRLQAKAGLTGYAQVYGKYNTSPYDKLLMDLMYLAHPGIAQDFKLIFGTVKVFFSPESTEGFDEREQSE